MPWPTNNGVGQLVPVDVAARMRDAGRPSRETGTPADTLATPFEAAADFLRAKAADAEAFFKQHGGRSLALPNETVYNQAAPWVEPPPGYELVLERGTITTPAANDTDTTVQTYVIPSGWDGVIRRIANLYTGPGQVIGSGYLTWRILRNNQPVKSFSALQDPFGSVTSGGALVPFDLGEGFRVYSEETLKFIVNHSSASSLPVANTYIITYLGGYLWPRIK